MPTSIALVRTLGFNPKGLANHGAAIYTLWTGHDPTDFISTGLAVPPSREDLPSIGAAVAKYRPSEAGALSYVAPCAGQGERLRRVAQSPACWGTPMIPTRVRRSRRNTPNGGIHLADGRDPGSAPGPADL